MDRILKLKKVFLIILFLTALWFRFYANMGSGLLQGAMQGTWVPGHDEAAYDELARNILEGRGLQLAIDCFMYRSLDLPFYPIFLSIVYATFGYRCVYAMVIQGFMSAGVPIFIYLIGRNLFNKKVGYIGGIITAIYLPFVLCAFVLMRETLFIFLFVISIYLLTQTLRKISYPRIFWAGVFMGMTALTRGFGYGLLPLSILWIFIVFGKNIRRSFILSIILTISFSVTVLPWVLRNYYIHKGFLLGETTGGRHFWTGAHPDYKGNHFNTDAWRELLWRDPKATEMDVEKRCWREAIGFIKKNPLYYIDMSIQRRDRLWVLPDSGKLFSKVKLENANDLITLLIVYLGIIGMVRSISNFRRSGLLLFILLFDMTFHGLFGATQRFRLPIEWCLILFASYTIYCIMNIGTLECRNLNRVFVTGDVEKGSVRIKRARMYIILFIVGFILVFNYFSKLYNAYFLKTPQIYRNVSREQIEASLEKRGLINIWKRQDEGLSFKNLCLFLADNKDYILNDRYEEALGKYSSYIVVWEGEINRIPKRGMLTGFDFTINPGIHDLGEGTVLCSVSSKSIDLTAGRFRERQRVVIVAEISRLSVLGTPLLVVYDIIPLEKQDEYK